LTSVTSPQPMMPHLMLVLFIGDKAKAQIHGCVTLFVPV
jgi:hypothetical protein